MRKPAAFYDYMLGMMSVPAPDCVSAEYMNAIEVKLSYHLNAILVRWFDAPTSPPEG